MRVLVACEFSGRVRDAFIERGHDAWSCDLIETEKPGPHLKVDVLEVLDCDWDLLIAFPPCTYLCRSGIHWNSRRPEREQLTHDALLFVMNLLGDGFIDNPIPKIALENPIGVISTRYRPPDQKIQPWQFGEDLGKTMCLWLKGLPKLVPTNPLSGGAGIPRADQNWDGQSIVGEKDRAKRRSITPQSIASAMAEQWG